MPLLELTSVSIATSDKQTTVSHYNYVQYRKISATTGARDRFGTRFNSPVTTICSGSGVPIILYVAGLLIQTDYRGCSWRVCVYYSEPGGTSVLGVTL